MARLLRIPRYRILVSLLSLPIILGQYFQAETGSEYGVGFLKKVILIFKMAWNNTRVNTASNFVEHLMMATQILRVPRSVPGSVVECGTFEGGSAVNLGLACALAGRKLELFDSFAGLPEPAGADRRHVLLGPQQVHTYTKGAFSGSEGTVRRNLELCGVMQLCDLHVGYFNETLPGFGRPVVLAYLDVDLVDSSKVCLQYLWPLLQDGCYLFTHEAHHLEIARLYFDDGWWQEVLRVDSPGLMGAGTGLGLWAAAGGYSSALAYTVKNPDQSKMAEIAQDPHGASS